MDSIFNIVSDIALLVFMWQFVLLKKKNKQLCENVDILQKQLIEALNKNIKKQDNFSTDPVS